MLTLDRQQQRQNIRWLLCLSVLMLLALLLSLCAGEQWISPGDWFTPRGELFVWQIRLPRTLAVLLVGAALAISGAVMQALFENPLAEPGLLGVSNGAGVGLIAAVLLGQGQLPNWALGLCAIAGALIITLILLRFARRHLSTSRLLLAGVALGIICSALMTWAIYFSTSVDLRQLMYWMMGGFGGVDWRQSWLMLALIPVLLWICCQSRPMNMLALGEISARQLGLPLWFWRNVLVAATGWMVGVSVALAGAIGFIGLVIPHILRLCGLTDHRVLLPGCALAGASALLLADIVARLALAAAELPIGVVTATLGAPVFIWLLLKARR
ncbi:TPA: vitamin B12 ABC transporter permease BtuC [Escherichia coli]|jgi:vitamin B12 transport system permease protein|uniref:Vitamin B12 import system permease protein BtuC n=1 Tax=Escherichia coli TaxID=562 RepID=A0A0K5RWK7_ECOLX|nr:MULTISPECIES: vitamin B12 ABC transporter permease BtuC [Enterobacteriaceae]EFA4257286.1 vitamin B12 ABC transporter permease BtuC [Escherichia coli O136:H26]EFB4108744.1 vitamin B12 ABC transporter permease BtuC [Escherichia coli O53]EFN8707430.1 vitamin B12 ABC transporter permease BtuC [Escherichia coli O130]EJB5374151.1 vitamin B12 ABC transporter permease BtuC [Shigella flexneri]QHN45691.1 vitamin B12 ABC transporter permease BtuC [Salmonella sp. S13]HEO8427034.1 vitamin B12 ABC trans